jgi:hypothetical protein
MSEPNAEKDAVTREVRKKRSGTEGADEDYC